MGEKYIFYFFAKMSNFFTIILLLFAKKVVILHREILITNLHIMKKTLNALFFLVVVLSVLAGCKKTREDYPLSNLRAIAKFNIDYYHNSACNVFIQHEGIIDEYNRTITVSVPTDADLSRLKPTIGLSPWTTCSPATLEAVDFSNGPVEYTVTAESGKKAYYTVTITNDYLYTDAKLLRLYLCDIPASEGEYDPEDPTSGKSASPKEYSDNVLTEMLLEPGSGYDLSAQRTHVDLSSSSHGAMVEVKALSDADYHEYTDNEIIDFSDTVVFRVTPQSGTAIRYRFVVREKLEETL